MSQLTYLMDEICNGVELYYTGRTGGQYLKTAFILCDDYTELTSKLFLLDKNSSWSDTKSNGTRFKTYHDVQTDVQEMVRSKSSASVGNVEQLHEAMKTRRDRRNEFFHSTRLLDLNVSQRNCVEAFCDLLDYGALLFGDRWNEEMSGARNLETLVILLRLEKKSFGDPSVTNRVNEVLKHLPRNMSTSAKKGVHVASHPEDLHTRLSVIHGGPELRDKLATLL